jgi:hypothetical protein
MALFMLAGCGDGAGGPAAIPEQYGGEGSSGDFEYKYWTGGPSGSRVTITKYTGADSGDLSIPATINGIPVTAIGDSTFDGKSLTSVTIPNTVTSIGYAAFQGNQLTNVTLPSGLTSIGMYAFRDSHLQSVDIPATVTSIGYSAFSQNQLQSVNIPASVASIEDLAFCQNSTLTAITVDESNTAYKSVDGVLFTKDGKTLLAYPEGKTEKTYTIPGGVEAIGRNAFDNVGMTSVTIPNGLASIGYGVFYQNQLTSVSIPASVASIREFAFCQNSTLTAITVDGSNTAYKSVDGVLFTKDGKTLHTYPGGKAKIYTIPGGVETIGEYAFYYVSMTSVTISSGVRSIEYGAFVGNQLTSVTIPASVTLIRNVAFHDNPLTSVSIGANVDVGSFWPGDFHTAYAGQGKAAGTYTRADAQTATTTWNWAP